MSTPVARIRKARLAFEAMPGEHKIEIMVEAGLMGRAAADAAIARLPPEERIAAGASRDPLASALHAYINAPPAIRGVVESMVAIVVDPGADPGDVEMSLSTLRHALGIDAGRGAARRAAPTLD